MIELLERFVGNSELSAFGTFVYNLNFQAQHIGKIGFQLNDIRIGGNTLLVLLLVAL